MKESCILEQNRPQNFTVCKDGENQTKDKAQKDRLSTLCGNNLTVARVINRCDCQYCFSEIGEWH